MKSRALRVVQNGSLDHAKKLHKIATSSNAVFVSIDDAADWLKVPADVAKDALLALTLAWNGRIVQDAEQLVVEFNPTRKVHWDVSGFHIPEWLSTLFALLRQQALYLGLASVFVGPFFIGYSMAWTSHLNENLTGLTIGASIGFAALGATASVLLRGIATVLPFAIVGVVVFTWERFGSQEPSWALIVCAVACFMQFETFFRFRRSQRETLSEREQDDDAFLSDGQRLQAFAERRERITTGDCMLRFGWAADKAASEIMALLNKVDGDVIDENGIVHVEPIVLRGRIDDRFITAYQRENQPPSIWRGLQMKTFVAVIVVAILGVATSPWNPTYASYVANYDITLVGIGSYLRMILAAAYMLPVLFVVYRLISNVIDRSEFSERRAFLEKLNLAASSDAHRRDRFEPQDAEMLAAYYSAKPGGEELIHFPVFHRKATVRERERTPGWSPLVEMQDETL